MIPFNKDAIASVHQAQLASILALLEKLEESLDKVNSWAVSSPSPYLRAKSLETKGLGEEEGNSYLIATS